MKILYLLKQDLDETGRAILTKHKQAHEVTVIDLRESTDYGSIVDAIAGHDRVISW